MGIRLSKRCRDSMALGECAMVSHRAVDRALERQGICAHASRVREVRRAPLNIHYRIGCYRRDEADLAAVLSRPETL